MSCQNKPNTTCTECEDLGTDACPENDNPGSVSCVDGNDVMQCSNCPLQHCCEDDGK